MGTKTIASFYGQTEANLIKAMAEQITTPLHDSSDSVYTTGSTQLIASGEDYDFECDGLTYEMVNLPDHITKLWDSDLNKCSLSELIDTPVIVARVQFNFLPSTANAGVMEFTAYIDELTPVLFQTIRVAFKATDSRMEALFAFYVGSETGYDIKTNGVKFKYNSSISGQVYDRGIFIYKT